MIDKTATVIDNGLCAEVAVRLARDFEQVLYYSDWRQAFPIRNDFSPGSGLDDEGVTRIFEPWTAMDNALEHAVWVFPDLFFADLQRYLRGMDCPTWGSGDGEYLELDRASFRKLMEKQGCDTANAYTVHGVTELARDVLAHDHDCFIKVSLIRGNTETWHHKSWDASQQWFSRLCLDLGPMAERTTFIVEEPIEDAVEIGWDGLVLAGQFAFPGMVGLEIKDAGLVARAGVDPPHALTRAMLAVESSFKDYTNFFSLEARFTQDACYPIDATCRFPSPSGPLQLEMWENFSEIVAGEQAEPKPAAKYGAEIILKSEWAASHWLPLTFPEQHRRHVKLRHFCKIDDRYWIIPHESKMSEVGSAIGLGDTLEEACDNALYVARSVEGQDVKFDERVLDKALAEVEKAVKVGVEF